MKLTTENRDVQRSEAFRETSFKIAASPQAFKILSSRIYTDPILAIVRELSTNAADAHVDAGTTDKNFDVHMPNSMDPYFSIRDFGTGLSQEDLETIYTTYFQSTRNDSNNYTGALGLGSKSPFSYTDMFTVTSYYYGTMYVYSAFKSESGEPAIALLNEAATDRPNGLEIKIEVKLGDHRDFHEAGQKVYRFFTPRPNVTGHRLDIPDPTPALQGDGYEFFEMRCREAGTPGKINVVMGNVCYTADSAATHSDLGFDCVLVLYTDIGTCEVAASREELHYDDRTKTHIQKLVDIAVAAARKDIDEKLKNYTIQIEKIIALRTYSSLLTVSYSASGINLCEEDKYRLTDLMINRNKLFLGGRRWDSEIRPSSNSTYIFVENDLPDGKIKQADKNRLRHWLMANRNGAKCFLCEIEDPARFAELFGAVTITMSALPNVPKQSRAGGYTGPRSFVKLLVHPNATRQTDRWKTMLDDDPDTSGAIAVPRKGFQVIWRDASHTTTGTIYSIAQALGYTKIYGIADKHYKRICDQLGLENLEEKAKEFAKVKVAGLTEFERARFHHDWDGSTPNALLKAIAGLSDTCDNLIAMSKAQEINYTIKQLFVTFGVEVPNDAADFQDNFKKRYPLLANVDLHYAEIKDITNYIKLIETNKGN